MRAGGLQKYPFFYSACSYRLRVLGPPFVEGGKSRLCCAEQRHQTAVVAPATRWRCPSPLRRTAHRPPHLRAPPKAAAAPPPPSLPHPPSTHLLHITSTPRCRRRSPTEPPAGADHGRRRVRSQVGPPVALGPDRSPHGAAGADADRVELQQPRLRRGRGERGLQRAGEEGAGRGQQSRRRRRLFPAGAPTEAASSSAGEEGISSHTAAGKAQAGFSRSYRVPPLNNRPSGDQKGWKAGHNTCECPCLGMPVEEGGDVFEAPVYLLPSILSQTLTAPSVWTQIWTPD